MSTGHSGRGISQSEKLVERNWILEGKKQDAGKRLVY